MIYLISIVFNKIDYVSKKDLYYAILGGFLNILKKDKTAYDALLKISFTLSDKFTLHISIDGEKNYLKITNLLLEQDQISMSVNGNKFEFDKISLDVKILDKDNIKVPKIAENFEINFLSPTFVRNSNIVHTLPLPERFIFSAWKRAKEFFGRDCLNDEYKTRLKNNIVVGKFLLNTETVFIKKATKAGVVGSCKYHIVDGTHEAKYLDMLFLTLISLPFLGMGSGAMLGLGNVKSYW